MALLTGPSLSPADFGLSINESNSQANTMEVGTPGYCGATLFRPLAPDLQSYIHKVHHHVSIAMDPGTPGSCWPLGPAARQVALSASRVAVVNSIA